jgi:hypothetical protein
MPATAMTASTVEFASAARNLTREARRRGLIGPSFRCPPRLVGIDRSIRRHDDGAIVAVRLRGRPWAAVLSDMIEGVVATNRLQSPHADRLRADLWELMGLDSIGRPTPTSDVSAAMVRVA